MAAPWVHPFYSWTQPQYYSPGYWQYVPTSYPMYQQHPLPEQQLVFRGQPGRQNPPSPRPELQLHRFLGGQRRPTAVWDVSQGILTARRITSHNSIEQVTPHFLSQPATEPPMSKMRIVSDSFRWDVIIDIPPRSSQRFISLKIVLDAIHGTLQEPLDQEEWREKCAADRRRIYRAMCSRLAKSPPSIKAGGCVWRIDCLEDRTVFLGLRPGGPSPEQWILSLGPQRLD